MSSILNTLEKFKTQELTVEEFLTDKIEIAKKNDHLNCFITKTFDQALKQAKKSDIKYKNGTNRRLEGIPIAIKDIFCTKNILTTAGSKVLHNFVPPYESHVTNLLQNQAGAISIGKLNMDEFAMGSSNETSYFGSVKNPLDINKSPGGSSGGSSAAVAANICHAALGTDTGGSIRQPASFTGVVGIKPTYGRCSRYGMISFASSLDQAGVLANSVEDAQIILDEMSSVYDFRDTTSFQSSNKIISHVLEKDIVVGLPIHILEKNKDGQFIIDFFKRHFTVKDITLKHAHLGVAAYYIVASSEASSNLARYDGIRYGYQKDLKSKNLFDLYSNNREFGEEVKRRIMLGTHVLSAGFQDTYYLKAQKIRRLIANDFIDSFNKVDFVVTPTTSDVAFDLNSIVNPVDMYLNDLYTIPASLAGVPAMSLPYKKKNSLPLGIHIIGNYWKESEMCHFAKKVERLIKTEVAS